MWVRKGLGVVGGGIVPTPVQAYTQPPITTRPPYCDSGFMRWADRLVAPLWYKTGISPCDYPTPTGEAISGVTVPAPPVMPESIGTTGGSDPAAQATYEANQQSTIGDIAALWGNVLSAPGAGEADCAPAFWCSYGTYIMLFGLGAIGLWAYSNLAGGRR